MGDRLLALKERAGVTLGVIAELGGYSGRSSVQRMFHERYNPEYLDPSTAKRLKKSLVGQGTPPIEDWEIDELVLDLGPNSPRERERERQARHNAIPTYTAVAPRGVQRDASGASIQGFVWKIDNRMQRLRPFKLFGKKVVALICGFSNMEPVYRYAQLLLFEYVDQISPQERCCLELDMRDDYNERVYFVGELVRMSDEDVILRQFNPPSEVRFERDQILSQLRSVSLWDII